MPGRRRKSRAPKPWPRSHRARRATACRHGLRSAPRPALGACRRRRCQSPQTHAPRSARPPADPRPAAIARSKAAAQRGIALRVQLDALAPQFLLQPVMPAQRAMMHHAKIETHWEKLRLGSGESVGRGGADMPEPVRAGQGAQAKGARSTPRARRLPPTAPAVPRRPGTPPPARAPAGNLAGRTPGPHRDHRAVPRTCSSGVQPRKRPSRAESRPIVMDRRMQRDFQPALGRIGP